jgi:hypothetical protein
MSDTDQTILNNMSGNIGPFAHSERTPRPNTLPKTVEPYNNSNTNTFIMPSFTYDFFKQVYHASHIYILYLFILLHLVIYTFLAFFLKNNDQDTVSLSLKRIFDFSVLFVIIANIIYYYSNSTTEQKNQIVYTIWNWSIDWMKDPINLYGISFFIVIFYLWIFLMHINIQDVYTPYFIKLLENKLWIVLFFFIIFFIIQYFFQIDIYGFFFGNELVNGVVTKLSNNQINASGLIIPDNLKGNVTIHGNISNISGNTNLYEKNVVKYDQVFNIDNNLYSYEDAQHVCTAYGARLANYDEIEDAYNRGGEWCNYGWSDGQMIYFPTQKSTWDQLQKDPKNKNKCGRPGINGGYMENKFLRFGVNCFGKKPDPKPEDLNRMHKPLPQTAEQAVIDQKVEFWKKNADALLKVNSFNNNQWSEY